MFCASIKRKLDKENDGSEPNKEKKAHRILKDNPKYIIVLTLWKRRENEVWENPKLKISNSNSFFYNGEMRKKILK